MNNEYYVYAYYFKSNNEIFYVGKGKNNRCLDTKHSRNSYFISILEKYKDDIDVKILHKDLTNVDACNLEKELIKKYKELGQCKANFHEGGLGGNTGNYEQVSKKLSEYYSTHKRSEKWYASNKVAAEKARGRKYPEEVHKKQSISMKKAWEDKQSPGNIKRLKNIEKYEWKPGHEPFNKGKKQSESTYKLMMNKDCPFIYEVYFNNTLVYWTISSNKLEIFCKETFNISRTIMYQIIAGTWVPKFNKHKYLSSLKIIKTDRSVSTNHDEFSDVEWRLRPFEVPGNLV